MIRSLLQTTRRMSTANCTTATNLRELFLCGVEAVKPNSLFESCSAVNVDSSFRHEGKRYHVVGFGKAVLGMAVQVERHLGSRLSGGCISIPSGTSERFAEASEFTLSPNSPIEVIECARNNLPDEGSLLAARKIKQIAHSMTAKDVLCVLISGGGSALLCLPKEPITLGEKLQVIKSLSSAGASIDELNYVRIALSEVKGGQLALAAKNAYRVYSYVISDIVRDPVALIASGPTVISEGIDVNGKAKEILLKYGLWNYLPNSVLEMIEKTTLKEVNETYNNHLFLLGSNELAVGRIEGEAQSRGLKCIVLSRQVEGNVIDLAAVYVALAEVLYNYKNDLLAGDIAIEKLRAVLGNLPYSDLKTEDFIKRAVEGKQEPLLIVGAGEPTVCVSGGGKGGRNQELALRFTYGVRELEHVPDSVCFLSAGTDGIDGPTDVAGALGGSFIARDLEETGQPVAKAKSFIEQNDSYSFYEALGDGQYFVKTGHTGTNVMDVHLLLVPNK